MITWKRRLLAGSALLSLAAPQAFAQPPTPAPASASATAGTPDDGLGERVAFEADTAVRDENGVLNTTGDVEVRYLGRTLRADNLVYDPGNGAFSANGEVVIVNPDGSAIFAKSIVLDDQLRAGVATGFSAISTDIGLLDEPIYPRLAAANAILHSDDLRELDHAIFSPCPICDDDGADKQPTWSVSAERIVQDRQRNLITYRNAIIRVKGVPVFWTPFFAQADPEAKRASGLLAPRFQQTRRRGFSYEQPFLWSISPSQDLVVSPQFNTQVNPFLNTTWRRRFQTGQVDARFGYTHERDFNTAGVKFGPERDKSYILAQGRFEPNENWIYGFTAERVGDKLLFDQYSITDLYEPRGLFFSDDRRLTSQLYGVRQDARSYLSISALSFQSLRALPISACSVAPNAGTLPCVFGVRPLEDDDPLPFVAPLVEARYEPQGAILGGRLRLRGTAVALARREAPGLPGTPGIDSRRASAELDWRSFLTLSNGMRIEPFVFGRGDYYSVSDLTPRTETTSRGLATIGVDVSWPFIRRAGDLTLILEPIAQLALSPDNRAYPLIPNEDSIAFDFNDTNLFEANKPPGFDLYEGGQRLNVGLRATADWGDGRNAQLVVGRSYRAEVDPVFADRTGLRSRASDWVIAAEATPITGLSLYTKARLEAGSLDVRRTEFGADVDLDRARGYVRYLREARDFAGLPREDVEAAGEVFFARNWGISFSAINDIQNDVWRKVAGGLVYLDDCTRFEVIYQREENPVLGGRTSDSIAVRLTLATLGGSGYRDQDRR